MFQVIYAKVRVLLIIIIVNLSKIINFDTAHSAALSSVMAIVGLGIGCLAFVALVAGFVLLLLLIARKCKRG